MTAAYNFQTFQITSAVCFVTIFAVRLLAPGESNHNGCSLQK